MRVVSVPIFFALYATAAEYRGQVTFAGLPVPGATVSLEQNSHVLSTISDADGHFGFIDVAPGSYKLKIEMRGFAGLNQAIEIGGKAPAAHWELTMLPLAQIETVASPPLSASVQPVAPQKPVEKQPHEATPQSSDEGFLINGSINNGSASPFGQADAFGNNRGTGKGLYNGGIGLKLDNSALDARPFSLTGLDTPKASYNRMTGLLSFGGPIRIPHILRNGPNLVLNYQWTRDRDAQTQSALVPTVAERDGVLPGMRIPASRLSPQALALLKFYPLPNANGRGYNYQVPLVSGEHQDALQMRLDKRVTQRDSLFGRFAFQSTRTDTPNLFQFVDSGTLLGLSANANWSHRFSQNFFLNLGYQFSRFSTRTTPFFANRENVSGAAGIGGNNQDPVNWGPPTLNFASGIASLSDQQSAFNRNETNGVTAGLLYSRGSHNILFGGGFRRQQFNYFAQQDPRGAFTFTGAATGSDLADFLLGTPDTSSIAYGNADKYFRESVYDAYLTDDWRVNPGLSINAGLRWDYGAPITELYDRLVNLDIANGFLAAAPVVASDPIGTVTGEHYPSSLTRPYRHGFEPRAGLAWRPRAGSSLVVRAGYGIYYDTSVYQTIALAMSQQSPLSKTLRVANSAQYPLTLADGFSTSSPTPNTFAVDPNFKVGYAQNWQISVQRDLPGSLQLTASYLGIKGTHALEDFLPNTYPPGAVNPCASCPSGFEYLTSNANSTRQAGQIQLRRRLHSGLTALTQYTFSKAIDNAALLGGSGAPSSSQAGATASQGNSGASGNGPNGGAGSSFTTASQIPPAIAQNWRDLAAERGLSTFDQRHLATFGLQYTTGMGLRGGTLLSGWRGALLKEWTFASDITAGSGLPLTPIYLAAVPGTGVTGSVRADYTGAPLNATGAGLHVNPAAFRAPSSGQWGNAGRGIISGPAQFSINASFGRTFRVSDRLNLDLRFDAVNALNRVNYTTWNTTIGSPQFGLPAAANAMRSIETTLRLRF